MNLPLMALESSAVLLPSLGLPHALLYRGTAVLPAGRPLSSSRATDAL